MAPSSEARGGPIEPAFRRFLAVIHGSLRPADDDHAGETGLFEFTDPFLEAFA